jgi:glucoselysine-6-phosphate deglycase
MEILHNAMAEKMYEYYRSQPACMSQILVDREARVGAFGAFYAEKRPDRIYLLGTGSSLNACRAAQDYVEHILQVEVSVTTPNGRPDIRGERPLVVAVSQGGKSTNTIACLRQVREKGHAIASFTAGLDVPVAAMADCAIDIGVGDETVGPKTRGYTGTVLCLYLAAIQAGVASKVLAGEACTRELGLLRETIGYGEENLERCDRFYRRHLAALKTATHYLFVGKGCAAAVGAEDALKVLETLCYPSAGYEFEEYLHGPACCTSQDTALFLFLPGDDDDQRMQKLAGITLKATENCYIIDRTSRLQGDKVLGLRAGDSKYLSPFVDIYFGQLISALLTQELGRFRHKAVREIFADMDTKVVVAAPAAAAPTR